MAGPVATKSSKESSTEQGRGRVRQRANPLVSSGPYADILAMQQVAGNQAVRELLESTRNNPQSNLSLSSGVPSIVRDVLGSPLLNIQPKLKIRTPNDKYEQEADRVAAQVMRIPEPQVQRQVASEEEEEEEEEETVQAKPVASQISPFVQRPVELTEEEKEETLQTKQLSDSSTSVLQRQVKLEEEEEKNQPKPISGQTISVIQRKCAKCQEEETIQPKLKIGAPNDKYEQEADRIADQVMRMPEPKVQRQMGSEEEEEKVRQAKPIFSQITPLIQRQVKPEKEGSEDAIQMDQLPSAGSVQRQPSEEKEELQMKSLESATSIQRQSIEEEEEQLQAKELLGRTLEVTPPVQGQIDSMRGRGQPLSEALRTFFEPRFGVDFSAVRVHTDMKATEAARRLDARAFTLGHDVFFGAGQYDPSTLEGRRILAHELTHTVQQKKLRRIPARIRQEKSMGNPLLVQREPAESGQEGDCASWESDRERFSEVIAEHHLRNDVDPSLVDEVGTPGRKPTSCKSRGPVCRVYFSSGADVLVSLRSMPDYLVAKLLKPPAPHCKYDYKCSSGNLVLVKRSCGNAGASSSKRTSEGASSSADTTRSGPGMKLGTGQPPPGWTKRGLIPVPEKEKERVNAAIKRVQAIVDDPDTHKICHGFFANNCPGGSQGSLPRTFAAAMLWKMTTPTGGELARGEVQGTTIAYSDSGYDQGVNKLAKTLVHELMHNCGIPGGKQHSLASVAERCIQKDRGPRSKKRRTERLGRLLERWDNLENARRWKNRLKAWVKRVEKRDLYPLAGGELSRLRARRAYRVLLLEKHGELKDLPLKAGVRTKLRSFISAFLLQRYGGLAGIQLDNEVRAKLRDFL